jgi:NMD protein affecting ribosome stability and mRNA decay
MKKMRDFCVRCGWPAPPGNDLCKKCVLRKKAADRYKRDSRKRKAARYRFEGGVL